MSLLTKLFSRSNPNLAMRPLYDAIVKQGRQLGWYEQGGVPDSLDGRFDMIAAIFCLVMFRLEEGDNNKQQLVWLTELFVEDMDGQLRQLGIGDMIVGKHVGKMMGALGGRLGAYRDAFIDDVDINDALVRNLYRGDTPEKPALEFTGNALKSFHKQLSVTPVDSVLDGNIPEACA